MMDNSSPEPNELVMNGNHGFPIKLLFGQTIRTDDVRRGFGINQNPCHS